MRRLRHRFHAARQHNIGLAHLDHMCRADDSLHPRTAQTVYRECRRFDGQSRPQRNMPRAVERIARGLLRITEHGVIELLGIEPSPVDGALRRDRTEFLSRKIAQLAAVTPHGRPRTAHNGNVPWFQHRNPGLQKFMNRKAKLASLAVGKLGSKEGTLRTLRIA